MSISRRTENVLRSACALEMLENRLLLSTTWQVQSDYFGTRDGVSQARSLRGLALSSDDQHVYAGFIQGTTSSAIRKVSSSGVATMIGNEPTPYGTNPPYTAGLEARVTTFNQPKGVATDDRGNVYATLTLDTTATSQNWAIYTGDLSALAVATRTSTSATSSTLSGIATAKIDGNYYVYLGWRNGQIERWNVSNVTNPVLDMSWGAAATPGKITLKTITADAYLNGLEVDSDGTIFVAGGLQGNTPFGDALIKIPAAAAAAGTVTSGTTSSVPVGGGANGSGGSAAMDLALFAGKVYVTEYLQTNSTVAVFRAADLSSLGTITPPNLTGPSGQSATYNSGADSGFAGIDVSADGQLYIVEQVYKFYASTTNPALAFTPPGGTPMLSTRVYLDRVIVSSPLDNQGPLASNVVVNPATVLNGSDGNITVTDSVDDSTTGGFYIASAEYSVDHGATWLPMAAADGAFDSEVAEDVTASFTLASVGISSAGTYDVWVRGTDSANQTGGFASATLTVQNGTPAADAGGPYTVAEGGTILLDGSGSSDPGNTALTYEWDFDNDGFYDDATGVNPVYAAGSQDGPGSATVGLKVTNIFNLSATDTATVDITNAAPSASIVGPGVGSTLSPVSFQIGADDPSSMDAPFSYLVDWGDGSTTTQTGGASVVVSKLYSTPASYSITVTATDKDGAASDPVTTSIVVALPANGTVGQDPCDPSLTSLFIVGTGANDTIEFTTVTGGIRVKYNGVYTTYSGITGRIFVWGLAGNDQIKVNDAVTNPIMAFGGAGDDRLEAPAKYTFASRVLIGGDGKDVLRSGKGQDILIGGNGADDIGADGANDVLVAGRSAWDDDPLALCALSKEWTSVAPYTNRVAHLTGTPGGLNGSVFLKVGTVFNDGIKDVVNAGGGSTTEDLWLVKKSGTDKDELKGYSIVDTLIEIV